MSESKTISYPNKTLSEVDPEIFSLIKKEQDRQAEGLELIASENFTSRAVMEALGSCLTNKYSEGLPGLRYYGGNEYIDKIENLCIQRALKAFHLDEKEWGVNVQPYSGSPANFAVYTALLQPHDRIMGLDLPSGGHLTHGYYTAKKKISATSIYFESLPYRVDYNTGYIDYDKLQEQASLYRPKLIICGASAYPRDFDFKRFREIADSVGALLMCDMAHISGLVASKVLSNPFEYCHIVTTTTHKSLRGPRSGVIFFRRGGDYNFEDRINQAVFPGIQGGPHNNTIAGIAVQLKEVATEEFAEYSRQIVKNSKTLAKLLSEKYEMKLVSGGTDNHLILWDLRPLGISGAVFQTLCDAICITLNKNSVPGDPNAVVPGGVRIGTPALTSRGLKEADFETVAEFLYRGLQIALKIQEKFGKKVADFKNGLPDNEEVKVLKEEVIKFSSKFPMPGLKTE